MGRFGLSGGVSLSEGDVELFWRVFCVMGFGVSWISWDEDLNNQPKEKPMMRVMVEEMRMGFMRFDSSVADGGDGGGHVFFAEGGGAGDHDVCASGVGDGGGFGTDAAIDFDVVGEAFLFSEVGGGADFIHDFVHEGLATEAGDDGHAEEEVDVFEVRDDGIERGCGIEGEAGEDACIADALECFGDIVIGLDVDSDEIGAGRDEAGEVVIGARDHEVHIQVNVVGLVNCLYDCGAEGDIIDEVAIHDVEVKPIGAGVDGAGGFLADFGEVGGEEGWSDDAVVEGSCDHVGGICRKVGKSESRKVGKSSMWLKIED